MPTKNDKTIIFDPTFMAFLNEIAEHESKSLSSLAKELILEALEKREDIELSALAEYRDKNEDATIGHEDAWK